MEEYAGQGTSMKPSGKLRDSTLHNHDCEDPKSYIVISTKQN